MVNYLLQEQTFLFNYTAQEIHLSVFLSFLETCSQKALRPARCRRLDVLRGHHAGGSSAPASRGVLKNRPRCSPRLFVELPAWQYSSQEEHKHEVNGFIISKVVFAYSSCVLLQEGRSAGEISLGVERGSGSDSGAQHPFSTRTCSPASRAVEPHLRGGLDSCHGRFVSCLF